MTNHFAPMAGPPANGSRFDAIPVISITALAGIPAFVRQAWGERLLQRANRAAMLDIEAIENEDCFIPHATMTTFGGALARLTGEEYFGLLIAPHLTIASYGCWGAYVLGAPTLGAAIERAIATIGFHSRGDAVALAVRGGQARFSYASAARGREGYVQVACGAAGVLISLCRSFLPLRWRPQQVELDIPKSRRPTTFEDSFGCPILFDASGVAVCFDAGLLQATRIPHPAATLITIDDLVRARVDCRKLKGFRDVLAEQIWSQVLSGTVSIESAARSLQTSVRTLQRELNRDGTDFRTLTNLVRTRRALELLRHSDASVTQIAAASGYSAPTHFARAFRKATGLSPREYRQFARNGG